MLGDELIWPYSKVSASQVRWFNFRPKAQSEKRAWRVVVGQTRSPPPSQKKKISRLVPLQTWPSPGQHRLACALEPEKGEQVERYARRGPDLLEQASLAARVEYLIVGYRWPRSPFVLRAGRWTLILPAKMVLGGSSGSRG